MKPLCAIFLLLFAGLGPVAQADCIDSQGFIACSVESDVDATKDLVFAYTAWQGVLPFILHRYGIIPGVQTTEDVTHMDWNEPGDSRTVVFDDQRTAHEQVLIYDRLSSPARFGYEVSVFSDPWFRAAVEFARGEWEFDSVGDSTHIKWTYSFKPREGAGGALKLIAKTQYLPYMERALGLLKSQLEVPALPTTFSYTKD